MPIKTWDEITCPFQNFQNDWEWISNFIPHISLSLLYIGLYVFNWPISVWVIERIFHSPCYHHNQIGSINLTHSYYIFLWLCAWDVCYHISYHLLHIHFRKTRISFPLLLCSLWWVGYVLACLLIVSVCLHITPSHYHHSANLTEYIENMKCLSDIFCRVCE